MKDIIRKYEKQIKKALTNGHIGEYSVLNKNMCKELAMSKNKEFYKQLLSKLQNKFKYILTQPNQQNVFNYYSKFDNGFKDDITVEFILFIEAGESHVYKVEKLIITKVTYENFFKVYIKVIPTAVSNEEINKETADMIKNYPNYIKNIRVRDNLFFIYDNFLIDKKLEYTSMEFEDILKLVGYFNDNHFLRVTQILFEIEDSQKAKLELFGNILKNINSTEFLFLFLDFIEPKLYNLTQNYTSNKNIVLSKYSKPVERRKASKELKLTKFYEDIVTEIETMLSEYEGEVI